MVKIKAEINFLPNNIKYHFTKKKRVVYVGCTEQGNLGDDAIFDAIRLMLKEDMCLYPISYAQPASGGFFRQIFFKNPDYIILGGGTIIKKGKEESYLRLLMQWHNLFPDSKMAVLGPGVVNPKFSNDIGFPIDIDAWKETLEKCTFISVRGPLSKAELDCWGMNKNIHVFYDPALWYVKKEFKTKKEQKKIAVNFANIKNRIHGGDSTLIEKFAFSIVRKLVLSGWEVYLYPTTKSDNHYMLETIGLKAINGIHVYSNFMNIYESTDFLESMDLLLGQRLHSVIFSACVATPFIALEYEPKTNDFLQSIGMADYSYRVDNLELRIIYEHLIDIYGNIHEEQRKLSEKLKTAKREQMRCVELFLTTK
ncbi:polysaccharide pyruvyl transferase family protein [Mangrovimonas xylaniphaga]|uniref:polysaccharide pyruvyl transferase family protein n=1 Tax=Mangrovimonas xylaniphaga TaxID=1645915 RepID=UPI00143B4391|nr:polysaccharide pyruvyl transferase family protein [Mangrovimonas xylaniphaga]